MNIFGTWPKIKYEPRDIWIGLYWDRNFEAVSHTTGCNSITFYLCIVPLFPIIIRVYWFVEAHDDSGAM